MREREAKLPASEDFVVPDLAVVVEGVTAHEPPPCLLDAVYYDTPDLRLARWGASLRHRSGDGAGWTVKLPGDADDSALVRRELAIQGEPGWIPTEAVDLVRAYTRQVALQPVARLHTRRVVVELHDAEGRRVAEVADDDVSVLEGERPGDRFREVEVEVSPAAPEALLDRIVARLRQAGAGAHEPTPKVIRALGPRALEPPELVTEKPSKDASVTDVVRAALTASVIRILCHDPGVRLGDDPEDVHQARVGTRRLRSDLRTFRPFLDEGWASGLREELGWLGAELGAVRDADVLLDRLRHQGAELAVGDAAGVAGLVGLLADEREARRARMLEVMGGVRYLDLLDRLVDGANAPRLRHKAQLRARPLLPSLVTRPWIRLKRTVDAVDDSSDESLHQVRIEAKRCRYAAEAVAPVIGRPAHAFARAAAEVQGVLGDHQDAVVTEAWLRQRSVELPPAQAMVAGQLVAAQQAEAAACRAAWPRAWKRASKKKLRSWLA
ncbi:MAG: CHAD domain-containing protein [Egibacteraceae bacterium]